MAQPHSVLIVDDDAATRDILSRMFRPLGFTSAQAEHNAQAVAQALILQPDLITTDMIRSGGSGLELIQQLRAMPTFSQTPIIMISGSATPSQRDQAEQLGPTLTLPKPISRRDLGRTLERIFPPER